MPFEKNLPLVTKREIVPPLPPQRDVWQGDGDGNIIQSHILLNATTVTELLVHNVNTTSCASHYRKSGTVCITPEHRLNETNIRFSVKLAHYVAQLARRREYSGRPEGL